MRRWGGALALGGGVTAAALVFGSRPLAVAGVGLLLAGGVSRVWAGLVQRDVGLRIVAEPERLVEGDRARLRVTAERRSVVPVGAATLHFGLGRLGVFDVALRGRGRKLQARIELGSVPRGMYSVTEAELVLGDHLGLSSVGVRTRPDGAALVVYPRLVALRGVFGDTATPAGDSRRLLLRRAAGFDFHSVRDWEQGESLRRVHWPTTARRGRLMVKELLDAPSDDVVVVLDCDPAGATGEPPRSSFDAAVRAAGSLMLAHAEQGRTTTLVMTGRRWRAPVSIRSAEAERDAVLAALAAAEPDAAHGLAQALRADDPALTRSGELVVVTGAPLASAASALLRTAAHRPVSVVWVDAPSFAGRPAKADVGVLRLVGSGIPVAVVRHGDDLATALQPTAARRAAHA